MNKSVRYQRDLFLVAIFCFALVGCTKFGSEQRQMDASLFVPGETGLNPSTDKLTETCFGKPEFDACLFQKNPVAQEKSPLTESEAEAKRRFGVKVRGLAPTGYLENTRVQVYALHSPRFHLSALAQLKVNGQSELAGQFSAYYWSNRMFDYFEARLGPERMPLKSLKVYADDAFTGFVAAGNSVHLERKEGRLPKAFSGEIVVHLSAQALAHALSGQRLFTKDPAQHNLCALDPKGCCATSLGCAQALGSGFGEYAAAMMFPDSVKMGESAANSPDGQKICSVARDLVTLASRSRAQVFAACAPQGRVALMGAWYASVWWKLRTQLEAQEAGAAVDVDKLFFDHARSWNANTTFTDAKNEALRLAGEYKNGKFALAFASAFNAAGI